MLESISVILPVYNGEKFLKECIESVLNQTHKSFELIIVNDGSEDASEEIVKSFNSERIKYFSKSNEGVAATRNFGLRKAKGDIISFIDQDDMWNEQYLSEVVKGMKKSDFIYVNGKYLINNNISHNIYTDEQSELNKTHNNLERLIEQNFIVSPTQVSIKKDVIQKIGMFDHTLDGSGADDWDYWIRVFSLSNIRILFIERPMIVYRFHDKNNSFNRDMMFKCKLDIFRKHKKLVVSEIGSAHYRQIKSFVTLQYGYYKIRNKKFINALILIGKAFIINPFILFDKKIIAIIRKKFEGG